MNVWSCGLSCCLCKGCPFASGVVFASIPEMIGVSFGLVAMYSFISCIALWYVLFSGSIWWTSKAWMLMKMWLWIWTTIQCLPWLLCWYLVASAVGIRMALSVFGCVDSVCFEYLVV